MIENVKYKRPPNTALKGRKNHRWNGGNSHFKNHHHHQLKLNRLEKLKQTRGRCEICDDGADKIYHKDGDRDNHNISNLVVACAGCMGKLHRVNGTYASKYKRKYGMSIAEMAIRAGMPYYRARQWLLGSEEKRDLLLKRAGIRIDE